MTKDIVSEIIDDHKIIRNLAQRYENENNTDERQKIANTVIREIAVHSACEEINLYPAFERHFTNGKEIADHSREEHLQELVHHIDEEESDFLPKFKETISQNELESLGASFAKTRVTAPTHPHPSAPDKPPAESLAGMTALPLDKTRDAVRDFVDTGRDKL
ncbi:12688_t:CDS:2 [Rhizophagus irregularis]|nr:12688_t:CDS:2 [Rhizophagus irregularis]